jgi:hypothetical protein
MKLGYNNENERMLHVQNIVSFLGGDKSGKYFRQFIKGLTFKLVELGWLKKQVPATFDALKK